MPNLKLKKKAQKLFDQNKLGAAKKLYQELVYADKQDTDSWLDLGTLHGMLNEPKQAADCFKQVLTLRPEFPEAYFNLGRALGLLGQLDEACQAYQQSIRLRPTWVQAMNNLANLLQSQGNYNEALAWYQQALNIAPTYAEALINQSNVFTFIGRNSKAIEGYRRALTLAPRHLLCHRNYCRTLYATGMLDEAMQGYEKMAQTFPDNPEPMAAKAWLLQLIGDKNAARAAIKPLIEQHPDNPFVAIAYADISHPAEKSLQRIELLERILLSKHPELNTETISQVHYILGKMYDKTADYNNAFQHYELANHLVKRPFSPQTHEKQVNDIIKVHSASALKAMPQVSGSGKKAIFIIGMPRSGTSLTEQILASHPAISGAGELNEIFDIADAISAQLDKHPLYPDFMPQLTDDLCQQMAQRYQQTLQQVSNTSLYVTDKMPQNFLYLGLISRLFPETHIIHCQRDPRDTCLSCYFQNFGTGHNYASDLKTLGHYYKHYQRLMHHWENVLKIPILPARYEELVNAPETTIKTMLDFIGLDWDDNCLNFHNSKRVVHTASYNQVKQPINQSSVARWRHYENVIQPLLDGLGTD